MARFGYDADAGSIVEYVANPVEETREDELLQDVTDAQAAVLDANEALELAQKGKQSADDELVLAQAAVNEWNEVKSSLPVEEVTDDIEAEEVPIRLSQKEEAEDEEDDDE